MRISYESLYNNCVEEYNRYGGSPSFWEEIPASSILNDARGVLGFEAWMEIFKIHFSSFFSSFDSSIVYPWGNVDELRNMRDDALQRHIRSWNGMGMEERISLSKRIVNDFKLSRSLDFHEFVQHKYGNIYGINAKCIESALDAKPPNRARLAREMIEVFGARHEYQFEGKYNSSYKMLEGRIAMRNLVAAVQVDFSIKYGFIYNVNYYDLDLRPLVGFPDQYESLLGLGFGEWNLVESEAAVRVASLFSTVVHRLTDIVGLSVE